MGLARHKDWVRVLSDFLWSSVVVAPLVVLYWRGTWDLLEDLVFPVREDSLSIGDEPTLSGLDANSTSIPAIQSTTNAPFLRQSTHRQLSGLVCYLAGLIVRISLDFVRFHLGEFLDKSSKLIRTVGGWLYTSIYALAGVSFWRGVFYLMKLDVGVGTGQLLVVLIGSLLVLIISKVPKSLISSPLALAMDKHEVTFEASTFFRKTPSDNWWFLIDVIFTNLVIRQLVVFSWWSLWALENHFLKLNFMGEDVADVSWDSLLLGYAGSMLVMGLDLVSANLTSTKLYIAKPLNTLLILLAFLSSVNVWRGIWSMLNHYFLAKIEPDENYIISHIAGLGILSVLLLANTISNDKIVLDCDTASVVNIEYWKPVGASKEGQEEMVPIVE